MQEPENEWVFLYNLVIWASILVGLGLVVDRILFYLVPVAA